jgi:hypothetical protein
MLIDSAEKLRKELIVAQKKNKSIYLSNAIRLLSGVIGNLKKLQ